MNFIWRNNNADADRKQDKVRRISYPEKVQSLVCISHIAFERNGPQFSMSDCWYPIEESIPLYKLYILRYHLKVLAH